MNIGNYHSQPRVPAFGDCPLMLGDKVRRLCDPFHPRNYCYGKVINICGIKKYKTVLHNSEIILEYPVIVTVEFEDGKIEDFLPHGIQIVLHDPRYE